MPIKFRCVYCNQLLGISRRKAGAVVRCKTCDGQLVVPDPAVATELAENRLPGVDSVTKEPPPVEKLFERDDFDKVLEPFQVPSSPAAVANPPAGSTTSRRDKTPPLIAAPMTPTAPAVVVLDRRQLTWAAVLAVLSLGLSFAVGLWVGLTLPK
jgi:hypothetical protein